MSALADVLKGIRASVALNDRVIELTKRVDKLADQQATLVERVVRVEAFIDIVKPAIQHRMLPPTDGR
ncbi:MAG: hypothetical protein ACREPY_18030 [Rhodanobacteraceae bacterium]